MDLDYWEKFYQHFDAPQQPSHFAQFCSRKYTEEMGVIFDVGCGNARDTLFFSSQSISCAGIDQCSFATEKNKIKVQDLGLKAEFFCADFSSFNYDNVASFHGYSIYSRFTLHAINYEEEKKFMDHLNSGVNLRYLFIEVRSVNDSLYGKGKKVGKHEFITSHYRRFIDPETLTCQLQENFEIEYFVESVGFAKTETEDPCLIRVIAKKR